MRSETVYPRQRFSPLERFVTFLYLFLPFYMMATLIKVATHIIMNITFHFTPVPIT